MPARIRSGTICELLGAPVQDWREFSAWTDHIVKVFSTNVASQAPDIVRAMDELGAYIDALVSNRRDSPGDDLLSNLIRAEDAGHRLTHDELLMLAGTVLTAGIDTRGNQLAAAVDEFCDHPDDQWALLAARPELAPEAVNEVMRHAPVTLGTARIAAEDAGLAGAVVPAGTQVFACTPQPTAILPQPKASMAAGASRVMSKRPPVLASRPALPLVCQPEGALSCS